MRGVIAGVVALIALAGCGPAAPRAPTRPPETPAAPTPSARPTAEPPTAAPTAAPPTAPSALPTPAEPEPLPPLRYVFPVQPAEGASYGREHHDYPATDIFSACGSAFVAPVDGRVDELSREDLWDPATDDPALRGGLFVSVVGDDGVRYYGSHLGEVAAGIEPGVRVTAGQLLGSVGRTGNARSTPCHLHFGLSPPGGPGDWEVRRGVLYPWPYLDAWKAGDQRSPAAEIHALAAAQAGTP